MKIITEIGKHVLPGLNKLDDAFKELKVGKNSADRGKTLVKLEKQLERIFGTLFSLELEYIGPFSDNFVVIPVFKKSGKLETKEDYVKLGIVKKMNIIIGMEMIRESRPRELTAVMLHEIGHVAGHISASVDKIYRIIKPINNITNIASRLPIIGMVVLPITILTSRTLNWTSHVHEYNADKFAVKYGYGDELSSIIHRWSLLKKKNEQSSKTLLQKLSIITSFINKKVMGTTHPKNPDRIKSIVEEMKKNYVGKYKSKRLQTILKHYDLND